MAGEGIKHLLLASKQAQIGELRVQVSAVQPRSLCESPADGAVTRMLQIIQGAHAIGAQSFSRGWKTGFTGVRLRKNSSVTLSAKHKARG